MAKKKSRKKAFLSTLLILIGVMLTVFTAVYLAISALRAKTEGNHQRANGEKVMEYIPEEWSEGSLHPDSKNTLASMEIDGINTVGVLVVQGEAYAVERDLVSGTPWNGNFVILDSYASLYPNEQVIFVDLSGTAYHYTVLNVVTENEKVDPADLQVYTNGWMKTSAVTLDMDAE